MRQPRTAAVAGGAGATTVAAALGAQDLGVYRGGPVELLVCRDTVLSVGLSHRAVAAAPFPPVLVVIASTPAAAPRAAAARLTMVRPHVARIVRVPFVARWREIAEPWQEAVAALARPPAQQPRHLRGFATAMSTVRQALLDQHARPALPPPPASPAWGTPAPRRS